MPLRCLRPSPWGRTARASLSRCSKPGPRLARKGEVNAGSNLSARFRPIRGSGERLAGGGHGSPRGGRERCREDRPAPGSASSRILGGEVKNAGRLGCLFTLLKFGTVSLELGLRPPQLGTATLDFRPSRLFSRCPILGCPVVAQRSFVMQSCRPTEPLRHPLHPQNHLARSTSPRSEKRAHGLKYPSPPSRLSFQLATTGNANTQLPTPRCPATLGVEPLGSRTRHRSQGAPRALPRNSPG
jgi:hypothetical protein